MDTRSKWHAGQRAKYPHMLAVLSDTAIDGDQYDRDLPARQDSTLY